MYITALLIGLLGSLHCVAMCSPITLLIGGNNAGSKFVFQRIIYNVGRLVGYASLGLMIGLFGKAASFFGLQQWFSIGFGVLLLVALILYGSKAVHNPSFGFINKLTSSLKKYFAKVYQWDSSFKGLIIGVLNGFLPCGLVYMALIGAMTMNTVGEAMIYMVIFGVGTWPMMLAVMFFGKLIKEKFSIGAIKVVPYLVAILFILRGLDLGVPYLSPRLTKTDSKEISNCVEPDTN